MLLSKATHCAFKLDMLCVFSGNLTKHSATLLCYKNTTICFAMKEIIKLAQFFSTQVILYIQAGSLQIKRFLR